MRWKSRPSEQEHAAEEEGPSVDTWSARNQQIEVSSRPGFLFTLQMRSKVDGSTPQDVYDVLTFPDSSKVFRGIQAVTYRKVLADNGKGQRRLQVGHRALTKFLWLSVAFETELVVDEDDAARTITFRNLHEKGFMRQFEGTWHVQPFTQATLDSIYKGPVGQQQHASGRHWFNPGAAFSALQHHFHHERHPAAALVTLEQSIAPRATPPGPVKSLVRGMCARVLTNMMDDLNAELARRHQKEEAAKKQAARAGRSAGGKDHGRGSMDSGASSTKSMALALASASTMRGPAPAASMTLSSGWGDLFAAAAPLQITVKL